MPRKKLSPWQKIIRAGDKGSGLTLNANEIAQLYADDAIFQKAVNDDEGGYDDDFYDEPISLQRVMRGPYPEEN